VRGRNSKRRGERRGDPAHPSVGPLHNPLYTLYPAAFADTDFWDDLARRLQSLCWEYSRAGQPRKIIFDLFLYLSVIWGTQAVLKEFQTFTPRKVTQLRRAQLVALYRNSGAKDEAEFIRNVIKSNKTDPHGRFAGPKRNISEATLRRYLDDALKEARAEPGYDGWIDKIGRKKKKS
jgi:hypothetical protein